MITDYVRYALASAGLSLSDEQVEAIYATGHPVAVTDYIVQDASQRTSPILSEMLVIMESCVAQAKKPDNSTKSTRR